mmetsp:Transcript_124399/g.387292  ORF Transcript_124399/g.387292 Transcript_124399/m.387292 type:complete len:304 (+) Transcript_124399:563-1474(+)
MPVSRFARPAARAALAKRAKSPSLCSASRKDRHSTRPFPSQSKKTKASCKRSLSNGTPSTTPSSTAASQARAAVSMRSKTDRLRNLARMGRWSLGWTWSGMGSESCGSMDTSSSFISSGWKNNASILTCLASVKLVARLGMSRMPQTQGCIRCRGRRRSFGTSAASAARKTRMCANLVAFRSPASITGAFQADCSSAKLASRQSSCATCLVRSLSWRGSSGFRARCVETKTTRPSAPPPSPPPASSNSARSAQRSRRSLPVSWHTESTKSMPSEASNLKTPRRQKIPQPSKELARGRLCQMLE